MKTASLETKGSYPKSVAKTIREEKWLRYDEPSLRQIGNEALFNKEIVCLTEDKLWDIVRAKDRFPQGLPKLAATKLPSNDYIEYVLKVNTVFRKTMSLGDGREIKVVFLSNLTKEEIIERLQ